ncbi:MAG: nuclear transport factor 2 family protein [Clostridia bacterium]|nr:nuclear transport factor 2 family protein [Clostridia bacterium]
MNEGSDIQQVYIEMYRAMIAKGITALSKVLDDSFVLVHMTGMRQMKKDFLKAVADGTLNYASAEHESIEVSKEDGHIVLTGKSRGLYKIRGTRVAIVTLDKP